MPEPIKRGSLLPFLQSEVWDFDPTRGYVYRQDYKGAGQAQMLLLQQDFVRAGIASRLVFNQGGTASLETEDPTQQYTIDVWQILGNEESRDGFSHPTIVGLVSPTGAANLRGDLSASPPKDPVTLNADLIAEGFSATNAATVVRFYTLALRGSEQYRHGQYVLRHTTNAPNRWGSNISDIGVDQLYTPAQLLSEAQNSSLWIVPLPSRLAYKIGQIPAPTFHSGYLWSWLKGASTETQAAHNRIDITTEYTLEQWSTDYYVPH